MLRCCRGNVFCFGHIISSSLICLWIRDGSNVMRWCVLARVGRTALCAVLQSVRPTRPASTPSSLSSLYENRLRAISNSFVRRHYLQRDIWRRSFRYEIENKTTMKLWSRRWLFQTSGFFSAIALYKWIKAWFFQLIFCQLSFCPACNN